MGFKNNKKHGEDDLMIINETNLYSNDAENEAVSESYKLSNEEIENPSVTLDEIDHLIEVVEEDPSGLNFETETLIDGVDDNQILENVIEVEKDVTMPEIVEYQIENELEQEFSFEPEETEIIEINEDEVVYDSDDLIDWENQQDQQFEKAPQAEMTDDQEINNNQMQQEEQSDNGYSLTNKLAHSDLQELSYMHEMNHWLFSEERPIDLSQKMGFFKRRKAIKYNQELEARLDENLNAEISNLKLAKEEYEAKYKEYEKEQKKYRDALFKL
ncbi:MAG: hypothetical protein ACRCVI_01220 [Mycoplasmoidaceae bacterium]